MEEEKEEEEWGVGPREEHSSSGGGDLVKVVVRIRPMSELEISTGLKVRAR